jgi:hypothetical protein
MHLHVALLLARVTQLYARFQSCVRVVAWLLLLEKRAREILMRQLYFVGCDDEVDLAWRVSTEMIRNGTVRKSGMEMNMVGIAYIFQDITTCLWPRGVGCDFFIAG